MRSMTAAQRRRMSDVLHDPCKFIPKLKVVQEDSAVVPFREPYQEQVALLKALNDPSIETIVVNKGRQIGGSTVNCAFSFYLTYTRPKGQALSTLLVAHEDLATDKLFTKIQGFHDSLPKSWQKATRRSNRKELVFDRSGAGIYCQTAGSKGGGRSATYQYLIAEELAFWPRARDFWSSITSTRHKTNISRTVIMSTPNGPGNLYHDKVLAARRAQDVDLDETVRYFFFPWAKHSTYAETPPEKWEPTQEEWELAQVYGLTIEQLYWRNQKIHGVKDGIGLDKFRREYPMTDEEGFLVFDGSWFNVDRINDEIGLLEDSGPAAQKQGTLRIYRMPERGELYGAGVDPSWCNGGDDATCTIIDSYGRVCAVLQCNLGGEYLFARRAADLTIAYNKALTVVEGNPGGAGKNVIKEMREHGANLKRYRVGKKYKDWTTHSGNREKLLSQFRQEYNGETLDIPDMQMLKQMAHFREEDGKLQGQDGEKDDLVMGCALAAEARRHLPVQNQMKRTKRAAAIKNELSPFALSAARLGRSV